MEFSQDPPSLYTNYREIHYQGMHELLEKYVIKVFGKVGFTVAVLLFWIPSMIMMIIGGVFRMDCPAERYIPVYLIMSGLVTILTLAWLIATQLDDRYSSRLDYFIKMHQIQWCLMALLFIWFVLGSYFVLRIAWPTQAQCHPILYRFAFVIICGQIFFIAFVSVVAMLVCCSNRSCCKYCSKKLLEVEQMDQTTTV